MEEGKKIIDTPADGDLEHAISSNWVYDHSVDQDAHHTPPLYNPLAGDYLKPLAWVGTAAGARTAGRMEYLSLWLPQTMTFDRIGLNVTIAASAGKSAILGCYKHTSGRVGTLQFDAGEVAIDSVALQLATIDQQLTAGWWWLLTNCEEQYSGDRMSAMYHAPTLGTTPTYANYGFYDAVAYPSPAVLPDTPAVAIGDISGSTLSYIYLRIKSVP